MTHYYSQVMCDISNTVKIDFFSGLCVIFLLQLVSIIDLIDAQKVALGADLTAANAIYTFMIDMVNVQRAVGRLFVTATQEERDVLFKRMEEYIAEKEKQ